jgi:transcriptional regulator with XRE-family HTH domain
VDIPLSETLRRLEAQIKERGLDRTAVLSAKELADKTSLPVKTVRALLQGKAMPAEPFNERVLARIKNVVALHLAETGKSETQLIGEVMTALGLSRPWARSVIRGEKVPNAKKLHELAIHFKLDGQETYFTSDADVVLNRELRKILLRFESPERDPIDALMEQWGVKATDMRAHGHATGITSKEQLAALLEGVFKSVLPPKGGQDR